MNQKYLPFIVLGGVLLVLIATIIVHGNTPVFPKPSAQIVSTDSQKTPEPASASTTPEPVTEPTKEEPVSPPPTATPTTTTTKTTTTKTAPKALTYEDALKLYSGKRIQFVGCRGTPGSFVTTKGSSFLLDNRDNATHTILVGTTKYTLKAYGFAIATANTVGTQNVTCDGGGAASINVQ